MTNSMESQLNHLAPAQVTSPFKLIGVLVGLLILTAATIALARVDTGAIGNLWLGIGVAALQANLVICYFMRSRGDNLFNGVVLIVALFFIVLFIGITVLDSREYHPDLSPTNGVAPHP